MAAFVRHYIMIHSVLPCVVQAALPAHTKPRTALRSCASHVPVLCARSAKESCCGLGSCLAQIVSYKFPDIGLSALLQALFEGHGPHELQLLQGAVVQDWADRRLTASAQLAPQQPGDVLGSVIALHNHS